MSLLQLGALQSPCSPIALHDFGDLTRLHERRACVPYRMISSADLLHDNEAMTARWIPFADPPIEDELDEDSDGPEEAVAQLPKQRNDQDIPKWALEAAPPSYARLVHLRNELKSAGDLTELEAFRNKTVLIVGCS